VQIRLVLVAVVVASCAKPSMVAPPPAPSGKCGSATCGAGEYCESASHGELRGEALVDIADATSCHAVPPPCRAAPADCDCLIDHGVELSTCQSQSIAQVATYRLRGQVVPESCEAKRCPRGTFCTAHSAGAQGFERAHGSLGFSVDCVALPERCATDATCACMQAATGGACIESRWGLEIRMPPPP
jgi:hypothetical protein